MCGIVGIAGPLGAGAQQRVNAMLDTMPHRGPNDRGVWANDQIGLGHLRLSIIDLSSAGHQPMWSTDERYALIFNGEVYNYIELRKELEQKGSQFQSQTDSEVIIEAYRHYGPDCVQHFNGMFAFAIWDTQERTLFIARDRFGIKPLFYHWNGEHLYFASEMKALLPHVPAQPNWSYYYHFFDRRTALGSDETVFQDILHLRPAHTITWQDGTITCRRYWSARPDVARHDHDYTQPVQTVRELVDDAIRLRLRSDVPVGICLSGGVDSSVIAVSLASQGVAPNTFSSVYAEPECNEEEFINAVNAAVGATPHRITPRPEDFFSVYEKIVHHHDEPVRMPGTYSHWHVMQCAHEHVTVLLDGQGGDEVFGGYHTFYASYLASLMTDMVCLRSPGEALASLRACLQGIRAQMGSARPLFQEAVARLLPGLVRRCLGRKRQRDTLFTADFLAAHRKPLEPAADEVALCNSFPSMLDREMYETFVETNMPMLLRYEDRNSMAFSLEARVPLLDHRIVEYVHGLSYRQKINGFTTKWVLREAYKDLLPQAVQNRKDKKGFPTPTSHWFASSLFPELSSRLREGPLSRLNVVDMNTVDQLLTEHQAGQRSHERTLFRLLTLSLWLEEHNLC